MELPEERLVRIINLCNTPTAEAGGGSAHPVFPTEGEIEGPCGADQTLV